MKRLIYLLRSCFLISFLSIAVSTSFAQEPPHPDNNGAGGGTNNGGPIGGAAGLAGGIGILLAAGGAYGAKKLYSNWKSLND